MIKRSGSVASNFKDKKEAIAILLLMYNIKLIITVKTAITIPLLLNSQFQTTDLITARLQLQLCSEAVFTDTMITNCYMLLNQIISISLLLASGLYYLVFVYE